MKTILAKEKSEYLHRLNDVINYHLDPVIRQSSYNRMQELEKQVKEIGDELQIIVTSKNTNKMKTAPPMTMEKIKK